MNERIFEEWCDTASEEDKKLRDRLDEFSDFFEDMLFAENSSAGSMVKCQVKVGDNSWKDDIVFLPEEITYFSYNNFDIRVKPMEKYGGYFDEEKRLLCISEIYARDDSVILHEMIHLHEFVLNGLPLFYHDVLLWVLYDDLKRKIKGLDKLVSSHAHILEQQSIYDKGGLHDICFLLKSLELDIRMGYRLGTVFGYDMEKFAKDLTY